MKNEVWKPVVGYEGLYEVSDTGKVKSVTRIVNRGNGILPISEKILTPSKNKVTVRHPSLRYSVELWKDGKRKRVPIARIVCAAFVSKPNNKCHVNHIDGDSTNDDASNLEWVTAQENNQHARRHGLISSRNQRKRVRGTNNKTGEVLVFESLTAAAKYFGVTKAAINAPIHGYGRSKMCKGYNLEYID